MIYSVVAGVCRLNGIPQAKWWAMNLVGPFWGIFVTPSGSAYRSVRLLWNAEEDMVVSRAFVRREAA